MVEGLMVFGEETDEDFAALLRSVADEVEDRGPRQWTPECDLEITWPCPESPAHAEISIVVYKDDLVVEAMDMFGGDDDG